MEDASIGDEDIDFPKLLNPLRYRAVQRRLIAHVGYPGETALTHFLNLFRGSLEVAIRGERVVAARDILGDVGEYDIGAFARELNGDSATLSTCSAGNEGNLPHEALHCVSPSFSESFDQSTVDRSESASLVTG